MLDAARLLLYSLFTSAQLGSATVARFSDADGLDALADALAATPAALSVAFDVRSAALSRGDAELAAETLALVTPLADRLGMAAARARLEDDAFRALDPAGYAALAARLGPAPAVTPLVDTVRGVLDANGLPTLVSGRTKSMYGVHQKALRKGIAPEAVFDRTGLRVLVDDEAQAYAAFAALLTAFPALPGETDDYIAHPKASGYRALHATVVLPGGEIAEIQVKTRAMHAAAEGSDHAHWRYKLANA